MRIKHSMKSVMSGLLAAITMLGSFPSVSVFAAQTNAYVDPADVWLATNNRTSELDANAVVTYGTANCEVCGHVTPQTCYRVPEYTRSGETALNRSVLYSDGTCIDGTSKANLDDGTPGIDAFFTGYHWTKSVCEVCGTLNVVDGGSSYSFGKDVYSLNACDYNFFLDFDNTTHRPYDSENHTTTLKKGKYCQFCHGTYARAEDKQEPHEITEIVDAQIGNQRFHITGECEDCGFIENEYAVAKSVVQSYYGIADGAAHTITLSDLSESGVNTSIRYGESANKCNLTSAPNYTEAGYYPVYYEITYRYAGESMKENGVSYVWLLADNSSSKVQSDTTTPHVHDYRFLETVRPTCTELGYDRFQCSVCGALQKTNYVPASGHDYKTVVIREASCQQGGLELHSCSKCGAFYTEATSMTDHKYQTTNVAATCTTNGYTEHKCIDCGYKYITDLTPLAKHDYREKVTDPTCTGRGFTTYTCADCSDTYVSDYKDPTGHEWDNGHEITHATCNGEGLIEYNCKHCDATKREAKSATGHTPGAAATCTEPQTCTVCGAILELPTGHHYSEAITVPTCTTMGFTTYTCDDCGKSYVGNYTDKTEHHYDSVITPATCTAMGYTTYTCTECGDEYTSDYVDKKPHNYQAVVTPATCTTMGFTTYTCADCEDSYVADYTEVLPHNYTKQIVPPTCTSQGYTIYTCPDCGKEYIADEKESIPHTFTSVVTEPTCLDMGYTTYTCEDCDYSYVADYTNPLGHDYVETVTEPTCTEIGYSTFNCSRCDASYVGNEKAKLPHNYDKTVTEPTCTEMGYTVFNCRDCGDTYTGAYTDAKGHSYKETVTPPTCTSLGYSTFTCEVCGASYKGNETAKAEHQYNSVVTKPTCTELGYTTITCSVFVWDNDGAITEFGLVKLLDDGTLTIELPQNKILTADNKVNIRVINENDGSPVKGITVTVTDINGGAASDITNSNGIAIVPVSDTDFTDANGNAQVKDSEGNLYNINVATELEGNIEGAEVKIADGKITVTLPDGTLIDYTDRTTVTVSDKDNAPVKDMSVNVKDSNGGDRTETTDANGKVIVPPLSEDMTDKDGNAQVKDENGNMYNVNVATETKGNIEGAEVKIADGKITVMLPDGTVIDYADRTTVTVTDKDNAPVKDMSVNVKDSNGGDRTDNTDKKRCCRSATAFTGYDGR